MSRTVLILFVLTLLVSAAAFADDGAVQGVGGAIRAMKEHPSVLMETMAVAIQVNSEREARVDCHFVFRNTGPATTVRMGYTTLTAAECAPPPESPLAPH